MLRIGFVENLKGQISFSIYNVSIITRKEDVIFISKYI